MTRTKITKEFVREAISDWEGEACIAQVEITEDGKMVTIRGFISADISDSLTLSNTQGDIRIPFKDVRGFKIMNRVDLLKLVDQLEYEVDQLRNQIRKVHLMTG